MRYLDFWEYDRKDLEKVAAKFQELTVKSEESPEDYPKSIFGPHTIGGSITKGFDIVEATPEQLFNVIAHYKGLIRFRFKPIFEVTPERVKAVTE